MRDNRPDPSFTPGKRGAAGVGWIAFGGDGKHLAFETISGGNLFKGGGTARALRSVVIDGARAKEYDALGLLNFDSNKAAHYCYEVHGASGENDLINVDGHESRLYNATVGTRFSDDGKSVSFVARDGGRFFRVTYDLVTTGPVMAALVPGSN
jgi:hypothetical protein